MESGYTIKMIDFNTDEEYTEEGFKIITRDVLEGSAGTGAEKKLLANIKTTEKEGERKRKFDNPQAEKIFTIVSTLTKFMNIKLEGKLEFIIRNVIKLNEKVMPNERDYKQMADDMVKRGKKKPEDYETAYNKSLIIITLCYYLIAIQTSIPSIKTSKTFPGCKKSFSGFPIDGTDNNSGLVYVACVSHKIRNNASLPWSSIKTRSASYIAKQMESMITKYILPTDEIQNGIKEVKTYSSSNPEQDIPEDYVIASGETS